MNPITVRTGRPGGPRLGDILEDGAGNRALVIDEPGTMDPGMVDRRYIVSVDDPENFTFVGDVRIVGNIVSPEPKVVAKPTDPILVLLAIAAGIALTHVVTIAWHYSLLLPACADVCDEPVVMDNVCLCRHTDDGDVTYTHPRSP